MDHEYRDGLALYLLWLALIKYLENKEVEIVFGVIVAVTGVFV